MNEIPVSMFEGLGGLLLVLILYTLLKKALLTSLLSSIIGFVMAQSILNGNVVEIVIINNTVTYHKIQSLPLHYILLGVAGIMTVMTFYILIMILLDRVESIDGGNEVARLED